MQVHSLIFPTAVLIFAASAYSETAVLTKSDVEHVVQKCIQESPPPAGCGEGDSCHTYVDQSVLCDGVRTHLRLLINEQAWNEPGSHKMVMKSPGPFLNLNHATTACGGASFVVQTGPVTWRCKSEGI